MRKSTISRLFATVCIITAAMAFTSCGDDYYWSPGGPPSGWTDTFYDSDLTGSWMLVQANGSPVGQNATNYMQFYGNGRGKYIYWDNGQLVDENIGYWCESPYGGYTNYQINIQYQYSHPVTMSYWFTSRYSVTMQWLTNTGYVTYVYNRVNNIP